MRIYSVAFFGHRYVDNIIKVENLLEEQIRRLIDENEYVDFLVGRNGDFDQCVSSSVLRVRKNHRDDNSALVLMLPYPTSEFLNNENYFHEYYTKDKTLLIKSLTYSKAQRCNTMRWKLFFIFTEFIGIYLFWNLKVTCSYLTKMQKKEILTKQEYLWDWET